MKLYTRLVNGLTINDSIQRNLSTIAMLPLGAFVFCVLLLSCNNDIDKTVGRLYKEACARNSDTIFLKDELGFDWDTMYWISMTCPLKDALSTVNYSHYWRDIGDRIVITKNRSIVYYKEMSYYGEYGYSGTVVNTEDSLLVIPAQEAVFKVEKNGELYILTPVTATRVP